MRSWWTADTQMEEREGGNPGDVGGREAEGVLLQDSVYVQREDQARLADGPHLERGAQPGVHRGGAAPPGGLEVRVHGLPRRRVGTAQVEAHRFQSRLGCF